MKQRSGFKYIKPSLKTMSGERGATQAGGPCKIARLAWGNTEKRGKRGQRWLMIIASLASGGGGGGLWRWNVEKVERGEEVVALFKRFLQEKREV